MLPAVQTGKPVSPIPAVVGGHIPYAAFCRKEAGRVANIPPGQARVGFRPTTAGPQMVVQTSPTEYHSFPVYHGLDPHDIALHSDFSHGSHLAQEVPVTQTRRQQTMRHQQGGWSAVGGTSRCHRASPAHRSDARRRHAATTHTTDRWRALASPLARVSCRTTVSRATTGTAASRRRMSSSCAFSQGGGGFCGRDQNPAAVRSVCSRCQIEAATSCLQRHWNTCAAPCSCRRGCCIRGQVRAAARQRRHGCLHAASASAPGAQ